MRKCVVVSDSFKGTLTSREICTIAKKTIRETFEDCEVITIPVADGGEGTVECFIQAMDAVPVHVEVTGALGNKVDAVYARLGSTAIIEMAAAAGLPQVGDRKSPGTATTYGVGELIAHAVAAGCKKILLGLGGSATNDGGCGCAAALGAAFYNRNGNRFLPVGDTMCEIEHIDVRAAKDALSGIELDVMCDVTNPLYGKNGAAYIFGPQKGADEAEVIALDHGLRHLSAKIKEALGVNLADLSGAGAAGGMGAGCVAFLGGHIQSGIDAILSAVRFDNYLAGADLVISGEGRVDSQSMLGKVISGIAKRTKAQGIPLIVVAGAVDDSCEDIYSYGVTAVFGTDRSAVDVSQLKNRSRKDYEATLRDIMHLIRCAEAFNR